MREINPQSDDMNFVVFPERRNFDTVNQPQRKACAGNFFMGGWQARRSVVVGYRERMNAHLNGAVYQLLRRQQAIGGRRMAVQVINNR